MGIEGNDYQPQPANNYDQVINHCFGNHNYSQDISYHYENHDLYNNYGNDNTGYGYGAQQSYGNSGLNFADKYGKGQYGDFGFGRAGISSYGKQTDDKSYGNALGSFGKTADLTDLSELKSVDRKDDGLDLAGLQSTRVSYAAEGLGLSNY